MVLAAIPAWTSVMRLMSSMTGPSWWATAVRSALNTVIAYVVGFGLAFALYLVRPEQDGGSPGPVETLLFVLAFYAALAPLVFICCVALDRWLVSRPSRWVVLAAGLLPAFAFQLLYWARPGYTGTTAWLVISGVIWAILAVKPRRRP
jgi:hypothetical protein